MIDSETGEQVAERAGQVDRQAHGHDPDRRRRAGQLPVRGARPEVRQAGHGRDANEPAVPTDPRRRRQRAADPPAVSSRRPHGCRQHARRCRPSCRRFPRRRNGMRQLRLFARAGAFTIVALIAVSVVRDADAAPSQPAQVPALSAVFAATSYAPGQLAKLRVLGRVRRLELQVIRAGAERKFSSVGRPWGPPVQYRFRRGSENIVRVRLGAWPSGLYFVRLTAPGGRAVAFAPFVLRPAVLGTARVAVVIPTYSWQAYNFFDSNRDGRGDSWYVDRAPAQRPARPPVLEQRQAAALPHAATRFPAHARPHRQGGRLPDRRGSRAASRAATTSPHATTRSSSRATRSTSRRTSTT